jgi:hypothetical protein
MGGREEGRKGVEREEGGIERAKGGRKGRGEEKGGKGREDTKEEAMQRGYLGSRRLFGPSTECANTPMPF